MNRLIILLACIYMLTPSQASSQTLDHFLGEVLIKTYHPIERIIETYPSFEGERTDLILKNVVSKEFNIYLLEFNHANIHEGHFLKELQNHPFIEVAQYNHILSNRAIPNDLQFDNQWQYINTGQSGGTAGADIDMDLAWDISTGGVTALGDTIVAAIIDDGFDWSHQDFGDNLWVNYAEIPNDGIDNDNNGYIDDYRGWNAYTDTDNITGGGHGTPVTGIIGAQGNNDLGVAGVNWDVKLMIIQGGGGEAEAIEAYSYCYAQRKRYNETAGQEGAYVVTTNSSWGSDFGQPDDAPLWCAFYDTLGVAGIVSCGATINGNQNVDIVGDLPTACPSDYLIAVTNMNDNDVKVTGAGYGSVTIDLGAFGQDTWTTASGNSYGGFGGTSGATPHVAGTVALMHSVTCPSFAAFAKADPAGASLLIKQYILDGVDPNTSLNGITVTEGRLNAFNALNAIVTNCNANECFAPYNIQTANLTANSVDISWEQGSQVSQVDLRYREQGSTPWLDLANVMSPHNITGLDTCTIYEYQLQAICGTDSIDWTSPLTVKTDGCCVPPSGFMFSNITDNSVDLSWNPVLAASSYTLGFKATTDTNWTNTSITGTSHTLDNLMGCTDYEVRIRTICSNGNQTIYTEFFSFTTLGCGQCVDGNYCEISAAESEFEWLESVVFNTINNASGNNDGYGNFTNLSTDIEVGSDHLITLTPGFDGSSYNEYFMVYIDYNQDGVFSSLDEVAYDAGSTSTTAISGTISIPLDATTGSTRMRITQRWNNPAGPCEDGYDYGETEDYCINILPTSNPICDFPVNISVLYPLGDQSVLLDWEDVQDALGYEVRYRLQGTTIWEGSTVSISEVTLDNFTECGDFEFGVKTICASDVSDFSPNDGFEISCTNLDDFIREYGISISPNPAADFLDITVKNYDKDWQYTLLDISGKIVKQGSSNQNTLNLSISEIPSGVFLVRINVDTEQITQKLIKI